MDLPENDTDMVYGLQTTPYRVLVHAITAGMLGKGLLATTEPFYTVNGYHNKSISLQYYYIIQGKNVKYQINTPFSSLHLHIKPRIQKNV